MKYLDTGFVLTEEGRLFDTNPMREGKGMLEFFNGEWTSDSPNVYLEDLMLGRILKPSEVELLMWFARGRRPSREESLYLDSIEFGCPLEDVEAARIERFVNSFRSK